MSVPRRAGRHGRRRGKARGRYEARRQGPQPVGPAARLVVRPACLQPLRRGNACGPDEMTTRAGVASHSSRAWLLLRGDRERVLRGGASSSRARAS